MRIAFLQLICLLSVLALPAGAAEPHTILLGNERHEISDTPQWRFEVLRESSGRFADIKIKPLRNDEFSLTLYFLADAADTARLDTPEKIAASVTAGAERYLPQIVEKKIVVQKVSPRGSYGALTVLTAAGLQGAPGEFRYQTRGMVRLSPEAALGFSLLSNETNSAAYRQLLNYVYGFIRMTPASASSATAARSSATASSRPKVPSAPAATPTPEPRLQLTPALPTPAPTPAPTPLPAPAPAPVTSPTAPPAPAARSVPPQPAQRGTLRDVRDCAGLPTNAEVMRCVSGRK